MSNLLTVQDPDENAVEQATETRRLLQEWADKHLPNTPKPVIEALTDERIKELRQAGVSEFQQGEAYLKEQGANPTSQFSALLGQYLYAVNRTHRMYYSADDTRAFSYALEGAVREFHKRFFQSGMKWNTHAEWLAVASAVCPVYSSSYQDYALYKALGVSRSVPSKIRVPGKLLDSEVPYRPTPTRSALDSEARFKDIEPWLATQSGTGSPSQRLSSFNLLGIQVHYMEADGPWIAGYLTLDDACRLRFRRVRLGAYLAEQGLSDAIVRQLVEKAKQQVADAEFVAYPNDTEWESAYTSGPGSCMADAAGEYNTWDDIHPVSAYSSALHGCGDNSLVLITSVQDGSITGRGILNLQSGNIVRWYSDSQAERVLKRSGVDTDDRRALRGSWLALISKNNRFIHPYVDGDAGYGDVRGTRVYLTDGRDICLQETGGSGYIGNSYFCSDTECEVGEDECVYQEETGTYISHECDGWRCPLIDEWVNSYRRTDVVLHGISTEISEHAWYRINQFATNMNGGRSKHDSNYSINDEELRDRFLNDHGIDDPFEQDDESEEEAA